MQTNLGFELKAKWPDEPPCVTKLAPGQQGERVTSEVSKYARLGNPSRSHPAESWFQQRMTVLFTLPLMATHSAQPPSPARKRPDLLLSSQKKFIISRCSGSQTQSRQSWIDRRLGRMERIDMGRAGAEITAQQTKAATIYLLIFKALKEVLIKLFNKPFLIISKYRISFNYNKILYLEVILPNKEASYFYRLKNIEKAYLRVFRGYKL
ncbi:hypothetical protein LZ32DRAFT_623162 [Colletotrichum eremochloae]|nr:hypothetical protein LZ32DRAFT_623162 [Colletotrichum eremochloae]